jgi:hypothetical protein
MCYRDKMFSDLIPEFISVKIDMDHSSDIIETAEREYSSLFPGNSFNWRYLDDRIND